MKLVVTFAASGLIFALSLAAQSQEEKVEETVAEDVPAVIRKVIQAVKPAGAPAPAKEEPKKDDEAATEIPRAPVVPLGPKFIRLHLQDGSVISGDLSVMEITVVTQFGKLVVPIAELRSFTPGLDSNAKVAETIQALVNKLSSDDFKTREQAHKDLATMGSRVQKELGQHTGTDNVELKRHVSEILKEIEEAAEEASDDEKANAGSQPWIRLDTVVTTNFTVIGKVEPQEFTIASKYGPLKIALGDITRAEREAGTRESLRKSFTVSGNSLAQRGFKSTGIRVQAGDKIILKADGNIVLTPWGNNAQSSPDGMANYGWYIANQIPCGALVGRIGEKGQAMKLGRNITFVAKAAGVLQLAIGVPNEQAGEGNQFPGEYKVNIRVEPK
ncbi:MAG: hypothetical protein IAF94_11040 [Pirellulaceae bacterium]|nr:hypothetical protein [Pirellulaceae bacterium]